MRRRFRHGSRWWRRLGWLVLAGLGGCASGPELAAPSFGEAAGRRRSPAPQVASRKTDAGGTPLAVVNGQPISRQRVVDLLLEAHGPGMLEQLVVLEAARQRVTAAGLTVGQAEIDSEYDAALRLLIDPLAGVTEGGFDRDAARRVLDAVLAERNVSFAEFMLGMERNACLRALAQARTSFSEADLRTELQRAYGERVVLRHIQLATTADVARVRAELARGKDFAEAARTHSANLVTAAAGGLLPPLALDDPDLPAALRETAQRLQPSEAAEAVHLGQWYHLLRLEQRLPAETRTLENVRGELERRLLRRRIGPAMQELYQELLRGAEVEILDPVLRTAYERSHPHQSS